MNTTMKKMESVLAPYFQALASAGFFLLVATALGRIITGEMSWVLWVFLVTGALALAVTLVFRAKAFWKWITQSSFKSGANLGLQALVILGILVIVEAIGLNHSFQWDLTKNKRFSLSAQSVSVLKALKAPVRAIGFFKKNTDKDMSDLLKMYSGVNTKFSYEFVDPDRNPALAKNYQVTQYGTVVFICENKTQKLNGTTEEQVTNSVIKVTREGTKNLYFTTGHGEADISQDGPQGLSQVRKTLEDEGYVVKPLLLAREKTIPNDATTLVVCGPKTDFLAKELSMLTAFVKNGGHLMVQIDPDTRTGELRKWLLDYGVEVGHNVLVDPLSRLFGADVLVPVVTQYEDHPITKDFKVMTLFPYSCTVDQAAKTPAGSTVQVLAKTSPGSWAKTDLGALKKGNGNFNTKEDKKGPLPIAVAVSLDVQAATPNDAANKKPQKAALVVFGNSSFVQNNYVNISGNRDLYMNALNFLAEEGDLIAIAAKESQFVPILLKPWQGKLIFVVPVIVLPLLILGAGGYIIWRRRSVFR